MSTVFVTGMNILKSKEDWSPRGMHVLVRAGTPELFAYHDRNQE